ncbi:MAG: hypothetical protein DWH98_04620 [Planctomycetota bacterium]|jgi:hypothetical protein|nr:hypothetical protein [Planctomycetia bacterium]RLS66168.1 MAG: hypothetical protein DWH98_04620 [Planctomycetota bacterium]
MDLLEKLADVSVPPVPAAKTFIAGVRRKLHPRLLAVHIVEFAFGAMSCAVLHLFAALFGAMEYTLRGSWPEASIRDQIDRRET